MPKRLQRRRTRGWRKPAGAICVTRGTDWGNPFKVGTPLDYELAGSRYQLTITRHLAVELFRAYVHERGWVEQLRRELAGHDLLCWCPLDQPCHADVLLELANPEMATTEGVTE